MSCGQRTKSGPRPVHLDCLPERISEAAATVRLWDGAGPAPSPKEDSEHEALRRRTQIGAGGGEKNCPVLTNSGPGQRPSSLNGISFKVGMKNVSGPPRAAPAPHAPVTLAQPDVVPTLPVQDVALLFQPLTQSLCPPGCGSLAEHPQLSQACMCRTGAQGPLPPARGPEGGHALGGPENRVQHCPAGGRPRALDLHPPLLR